MRNVPSLIALACALGVTGLFRATTAQCEVWSSAISLWRHAVTVSPDSSIVHTNLADAIMSLPPEPATTRAAAHHYRRALQLEPRDAIAAHHFGDALYRMGDHEGALGLYLYSLRLDPNRPTIFVPLGQLLVARGKADRAVLLLRERLQRAPDDLVAAGFLADLLATHPDQNVRDGCEAENLASRVSLAYGHSDARTLLTWATAQAEEGRWDEAVATARQGLRLADRHRQGGLAREFRHRLDLFEQELPYRHGD